MNLSKASKQICKRRQKEEETPLIHHTGEPIPICEFVQKSSICLTFDIRLWFTFCIVVSHFVNQKGDAQTVKTTTFYLSKMASRGGKRTGNCTGSTSRETILSLDAHECMGQVSILRGLIVLIRALQCLPSANAQVHAVF